MAKDMPPFLMSLIPLPSHSSPAWLLCRVTPCTLLGPRPLEELLTLRGIRTQTTNAGVPEPSGKLQGLGGKAESRVLGWVLGLSLAS